MGPLSVEHRNCSTSRPTRKCCAACTLRCAELAAAAAWLRCSAISHGAMHVKEHGIQSARTKNHYTPLQVHE